MTSSCCRHIHARAFGGLFITLSLILSAPAADPTASFYRGLNLNGPPVMIDGNRWEGSESKHYVCQDRAFENQAVTLVPATDAERAKMIRSSRWGGNRVELTNIPAGTYTRFLYVWEDNQAETYSIAFNGRQVVASYNSGSTGHWERLGPWTTSPVDNKIVLTSQGGAANFSGIELWRGQYDGMGAPIGGEELAFFEKRIRPLLANRCYQCHSGEAKELGGELLVDSRGTLRRGGASGPAVVPGDPTNSLLIEAVRHDNLDLQMPSDEKLSGDEIADLKHWVKIGEPAPRSAVTQHIGKQIDVAAAREFWSLRKIANPPAPVVNDVSWPRNDIDRFILAKLEEQQLRPAADADKRTLIRRATASKVQRSRAWLCGDRCARRTIRNRVHDEFYYACSSSSRDPFCDRRSGNASLEETIYLHAPRLRPSDCRPSCTHRVQRWTL